MPEFVNPDTGEIEEIEEGTDRLFWVAQQLQQAKDQEKAWAARAGMLAAAIIGEQDERKAVYGDVSVRVQQNLRREFDPDGFHEWASDACLNERELADLAFAAKAYIVDVDHMAPRLVEAIARNTHEKATRAFVVVERVRKLAPTREPQAVTS